jgi:hypothetical protein
VAEYLSNEYQNLKDQKKIINESRQESNHDERTLIKNKKKREIQTQNNSFTKNSYRLFRADVLGNSTEISQA